MLCVQLRSQDFMGPPEPRTRSANCVRPGMTYLDNCKTMTVVKLVEQGEHAGKWAVKSSKRSSRRNVYMAEEHILELAEKEDD